MAKTAAPPRMVSIPSARMGMRLGCVALAGILTAGGAAFLTRAPTTLPGSPHLASASPEEPTAPDPHRFASLDAPSPTSSTDLPPEAPLPAPAGNVASTATPPPAETPTENPVLAEAAPRIVPLPVPRPPELRTGRVAAAPRLQRPSRSVPQAPPPAEEPSFIERLFGIKPDPGRPTPALSYAALENGAADSAFRRRIVPVPAPPPGNGGVAVYDISARTVTLPSGERLEAHSGLGPMMDNPDHAHVPMRGVTPPGTYDLVEREKSFHGVRAIRLNPVGGSAAVHGRTGLLAHTYMLGPTGASNGCVAFRDYDRFLQAYLKGEVSRLVVVSGRG